MPTKTFFNLSKEKQKLLIDASEREFSRVSFSEASINQIIQDAKVPRGSFYMYFMDKEDLYFYILEKYKIKMHQLFLKQLVEKKGDFILAWEEMHEIIIQFCMHPKKKGLFQNFFLNMRYTTDKKIISNPPKGVIEKYRKQLISLINRNFYHFSTDDELMEAFSMIMMITTGSIVYTFMNPLEKEKEKSSYLRRLDMIKYGLYQERKDESC